MNKLGISENDIEYFENKLFEFKSSLIDYRVTFNESDFNLDYLIKLHEFLFGDLYVNNGVSSRFDEKDINQIKAKISDLVYLIKTEYEDIDYIHDLINEIVNLQIFDDGNNRTIDLFVKNVISSFRDKNIEYYDNLLNKGMKMN